MGAVDDELRRKPRLAQRGPQRVLFDRERGIERIPADIEPHDTFRHYLKVKREKMGHLSESVPTR